MKTPALKIVELAMYLPLPYAGAFFANSGSRVVKIENPAGGDPLRSIDEGIYTALNGKKEIRALSLRSAGDIEEIRSILADADVVLNGFRRGFLDQVGIGYRDMKQINEKIIYVSLAGFEQGLPLSDKAGHDLNFMALSGIMTNFSDKTKPLPFLAADMAGALWAIIGTLYMVNKRYAEGTGGDLDLSLFRSVLSFFPFFYFSEKGGGIDQGLFDGRFGCYNVFECRDGRYIAVGSLEEKFYRRLLEILGIRDPGQFLPEAQEKLIEMMRGCFLREDASHWAGRFGAEDICVSPVLTKEELIRYLQVEGGISGIQDFLLFPFAGNGAR